MGQFFFQTLFFLFLTALPLHLSAQSGCTDPQALNYISTATSNDGSCLYPVTSYMPMIKANLASDLNEISGLVYADGRWWGHADSGNPDEFYQVGPETGALPQKVKLKNASNEDWEDITTDGTRLYIGDFGNNENDRQDLGIYRLPISDIGSDATESIDDDEWKFFPFVYTDQTDFSTQPADSTVYDCEAMIFFNGSPHLFTKNRKNGTTTHYVVNTSTGQASPLETFNTEGQITGASLSPDGKLLILLGYDISGVPQIFCWLLWDWQDGLFFNGNKRRLELGNVFTLGQAEAVAFGTNRSGYLANERVTVNGIIITPARTYAFDVGAWVPEMVNTKTADELETRLTPNPFGQTVQLPVFQGPQPDYLHVYNAWGQTVLQATNWPSGLDTSGWPAGAYVFTWGWGTRQVIKKAVKLN